MTTEKQRTTTSEEHHTSLVISGFPDLPNRYGPGNLRADRVVLHYRSGGRITATVYGRWVVGDGVATDDRISRDYDALDGGTPEWPDWLAELAREHAPVRLNSAERAMLRYALELAEDKMATEPGEFAAVDHAALASLKKLVDREPCARCTHSKAEHNISGCIACPGGWRAGHQFVAVGEDVPSDD